MTVAIQNKKVVFVSNLQENLYEKLLIKGLFDNFYEVKSVSSSHFIFLPKIFQWGKMDILHLHDVVHIFLAASHPLKRWIKFGIFVFQLLIVRMMGVQTVWTVHEWVDKTGGKWGEIHPVWLMFLSKLLDGLISHSHSTMDVAISELSFKPDSSTSVIMHGNYIDAYLNDLSLSEARQTLGISDDQYVFLLFGNILRSKGFLEAIEAFRAIDHKNRFLLVVGFPGEEGIEEEISRRIDGVKNIVFIPNKIPNDDIQLYMNACSCVVLPYKVFTTSGVAILAMSFAKPCVVPKAGYFAEVLDEQGAFFYDSSTSEGLQQAMEFAIAHRTQTEEMGAHNFAKAKQWSWEYVARETAKLYGKVLNTNV